MHIVQYKSEQVILELFHSDYSFVIGKVYINICVPLWHTVTIYYNSGSRKMFASVNAPLEALLYSY
jgi:hypothetical protein